MTVIWNPILFPRCGQIAIATACILFGQNWGQIPCNQVFEDALFFFIAEDRIEGVLMSLHVETGHPGIDHLFLQPRLDVNFTRT